MSEGVGELDVYPSIWGHWAGGPPGNMEDVKWLDERLKSILAKTPVSTAGIVSGTDSLKLS
jgi:homoserine O-acetyltransferase